MKVSWTISSASALQRNKFVRNLMHKGLIKRNGLCVVQNRINCCHKDTLNLKSNNEEFCETTNTRKPIPVVLITLTNEGISHQSDRLILLNLVPPVFAILRDLKFRCSSYLSTPLSSSQVSEFQARNFSNSCFSLNDIFFVSVMRISFLTGITGESILIFSFSSNQIR